MNEQPEQTVKDVLSGFVCSKNTDVQKYLRETAVRHEASHISRTHLIFDNDPAERLVAYITIAVKCLNLDDERYDDALTKRMNVNNGIAQSYLIGQLGKIDDYSNNVGDFAFNFALGVIAKANQLVGFRVVRLDCRDVLVNYYEKKGFRLLNKNSKKDLNRMIRVIA